MVKLISNQSAPATCGHPQTGSSKVFVQGMGASRVGVDTGGGIILSPGSSKVFIEGSKASLVGDLIAGHGLGPHAGPVTTATQSKVFAS